MNEIVKYDNQMNQIAFTNLTAIDIDLFMLLCARTRDRKDELIKLTFTELKRELGLSNKSDKFFAAEIQRLSKKLKHIGGSFSNGTSFDEFTLFPTFHGTAAEEEHAIYGHLEKGTLVVRVNPDFAFLLNELTKNFTRFELSEFVKLESKYSKNLYRLLKQYRRTGTYKVEADKFRELMDCPKSYANMYFMRDCVGVAVKELSHGYFKGLKVEPIRAKKRGAPIVAYTFTFQKSKDIPGQHTLEDYTGQEPAAPAPKPKRQKKPKENSFNNFPQRNYDSDFYAALEKAQHNRGE